VRRLTASHETLVGVGVVALAPLVGVLVLRAPLMNNLAYRDPWFYSGYGWALQHHIEVFGWFYYSVRFPVILPIRWSTDLLGPVTGALVLRYVLLAGAGAAFYVCVRRFASVGVATVSTLLLAFNPYYLRMVLWDYTSYVALPCAVAGVALWLMSSVRGRVFWPFLVSGALYGAAVFANPFSALFAAPLLLIEGLAAIRLGVREIGRLVLRCASAALGIALLFLGGYLTYRAYLGDISPKDLITPTTDFARSNDQFSSPFQRPASEFLDGEPRIYAPVILAVGVLILLGRRFADTTLKARVAQYAVGYIAVLWIYRFAVTSAAIETWWAYNMTAAAMTFAVPVILDELEHRTDRQRSWPLLAVVLGGAAATTFVIRNFNSSAVDLYEKARDNVPAVIVVLLLSVALVIALKLVRNSVARTATAVAFFALVAIVSLMPARYIGIGQTGEFAPDGRSELWGYQAAYDLARLLEQTDQPNSRTLLWTTAYGFTSVVWTNLPHQGGAIENAEAPPATLEKVQPWEASLVDYPTTDEVLLLSNDEADMTRGVRALGAVHVSPVIRRRGTWANGHLHYALVHVTPPFS
jgi:hypothetical protein